MDWLTATPLAHRGLHGDGIPENTLAAFRAACDRELPVELDVHLTRDGQVAVIHDDDLRRVAGRPLKIRDASVEDLYAARVLGTDEHVPTLDEVLDVLGGRVAVMIELKNLSGAVGPLEQAVHDRLGTYGGPACVASFNPRSILWFARNAPEVVRGQTASSFADVAMPAPVRVALRGMVANRWSRPHFLSYDLRDLPSEPVERWRERGLPLITWTVRTAADVAKARTVADNFIFEGVSI